MIVAKEINFKYKPGFLEKLTGEFVILWRSRSTFCFSIFTVLLFILLAILISKGYLWFSVYFMCFVLGMWSMLFWRTLRVTSVYMRHMQRLDERERDYHLDESKGFGFDSKYSSGWFFWDEFSCIKETRCFFLLYFHDGIVRMIGKKTLPEETIIAIRDILKKTSVPKKSLRDN